MASRSQTVRLLLVEDMEEMRTILRRLLNAMGFNNLDLARNGEEAWTLLGQHDYDVVLCDWNMPKLSGRALLQRVRADPRLMNLPFIMITGENTSGQVKDAIAGGVTDFIVKPFTAALLEQRLLKAMSLQLPPLSDGTNL